MSAVLACLFSYSFDSFYGVMMYVFVCMEYSEYNQARSSIMESASILKIYVASGWLYILEDWTE